MNIPVQIISKEIDRKYQKLMLEETKNQMFCKYCGTELGVFELESDACVNCVYLYEK